MKNQFFPGSSAALWLCPFRTFFLLTAAHASIAMACWLGSLAGLLTLPELPGGSVVWHIHEMLFGFATAALAGFLLTAVVEFTGTPPLDRRSVQTLLLLWAGGRLAYLLAGWLGVWPAALCDLAFLGMLLVKTGGPLWRDPNRRHLAFFHALAALTANHAGFYLALAGDGDVMAWLRLAIGLLMMLIVVAMSRISMRLVNDVLAGQGGISAPYLARPPRRNLATFTIALYSLGEFLLPGNAAGGWLAMAAAAAMLNLLNDWHVGRALGQRWVLVPYLVYWLIALGYGLIGGGRLAGENWQSAGHHLLLAGAMGLAILIVMAVAGRMHSGHGLDHRRWLPLTAALLVALGLLRAAAGLPAFAAAYLALLNLAGLLWLLAWGVYLTHSWRVLGGPRPDAGGGCDEAAPSTARSHP